MEKEVLIKKTDGSMEPFQSGKLRRSLRRAGASDEHVEEIVAEVLGMLESRMSTTQIYKKAHSLLRKKEACTVTARYSLKRAVFALGPSGFPFEAFIGELYQAEGYRVSNNDILEGRCVSHETDMLATSDNKTIAAEIKFHNRLGIKTDLKAALYVKARFDDLVGVYDKKLDVTISEGVLITNTKFTSNAERYGTCAGLSMISWSYPHKDGNLHARIIGAGLHPVTCLPSISSREKRILLEHNLVLCRDIKEHSGELVRYGISEKKIPVLLEEASTLCQSCEKV
ncbi:MAG: ATP cone domain-containing protein [Candidatus Pacebacteria bacterium]|nr:ATP cone domain-containing protein [Candidatus Paceibacterota bacterium]